MNESPKCESPTKLKAPNNADFTNTSNMLTMLSKAETKLKAQAALKAGILFTESCFYAVNISIRVSDYF